MPGTNFASDYPYEKTYGYSRAVRAGGQVFVSGTTARGAATADQSCARQERDLAAFAERAGYEVIGTYKEAASGVRTDRAERRKVMALAQRREVNAVLVTELSRWGRRTTDLLITLCELETWRTPLILATLH